MAIARKSTAKPAAVAAKAAPASTLTGPDSTARAAEPAPQAAVALIRDSADSALAQARETQERFRKAAEEGMEKTRETYARIKAEAEVAAGSLETSFAAAREGLQSLNSKTFDAIKTHSQVGFDHAKALLAAKGPQDFFTLQAEFARKQFETFAAQAKELTNHMQSVTMQTVEPLKTIASQRFPA